MLHVAIQEIESVRLIALDGEAIAAEVELSPAREIVFVLSLLGPVLEVAIVDRLGPANACAAIGKRSSAMTAIEDGDARNNFGRRVESFMGSS